MQHGPPTAACASVWHEHAQVLKAYAFTLPAQDDAGRVPLHYAAHLGHVQCINVMLSCFSGMRPGWVITTPNTPSTALVNARSRMGFTPLHYAVWANNRGAVQVGPCCCVCA
jgi:ankyrin repeat protein